MRDTRVRNATIESTFLGIEDHGFFIAQVGMDYGSSGQAFQRILSPESTREVLTSILLAVGVDAWEKLLGKNCRVVVEGGLIRQIGHITQENWTAFDWE